MVHVLTRPDEAHTMSVTVTFMVGGPVVARRGLLVSEDGDFDTVTVGRDDGSVRLVLAGESGELSTFLACVFAAIDDPTMH